jgi:DNA (cytosine-5)-methyltransferase 1
MEWDQPGSVVTTQCIGIGNGRFAHPEQDRAISLREAALLQTFPEGYKFLEPEKRLSMQAVARHIGNAVPVRLGQVVAGSIKNHLEVSFG